MRYFSCESFHIHIRFLFQHDTHMAPLFSYRRFPPPNQRLPHRPIQMILDVCLLQSKHLSSVFPDVIAWFNLRVKGFDFSFVGFGICVHVKFFSISSQLKQAGSELFFENLVPCVRRGLLAIALWRVLALLFSYYFCSLDFFFSSKMKEHYFFIIISDIE